MVVSQPQAGGLPAACPVLWAPRGQLAPAARGGRPADPDDDEPPACTAEQLRMDDFLVELHSRLPRMPRRRPRPLMQQPRSEEGSWRSRDTDAGTPVTFPLSNSPRSSALHTASPRSSTALACPPPRLCAARGSGADCGGGEDEGDGEEGDEEEAAFLADLEAEEAAAAAEEEAFLAGLMAADDGSESGETAPPSQCTAGSAADEDEEAVFLQSLTGITSRESGPPPGPPRQRARGEVVYESIRPVRDIAAAFNAQRAAAAEGAARPQLAPTGRR
eukprot:TRINITY_DN60878_c0_g1_i1.p2 TRINITY_DN60878_c0_g1~~TRINITY_DN60878_c0_g1_i1.p2  ORF type:complete len:275 (+),score=88.62 TRINITY_DN60878_c0_g1_i1:88-912(+)